MWDYNLSRRSVTILYPDGVTHITTTDPYFIKLFEEELGNITSMTEGTEAIIDAYLADMAQELEQSGRKPKVK